MKSVYTHSRIVSQQGMKYIHTIGFGRARILSKKSERKFLSVISLIYSVFFIHSPLYFIIIIIFFVCLKRRTPNKQLRDAIHNSHGHRMFYAYTRTRYSHLYLTLVVCFQTQAIRNLFALFLCRRSEFSSFISIIFRIPMWVTHTYTHAVSPGVTSVHVVHVLLLRTTIARIIFKTLFN